VRTSAWRDVTQDGEQRKRRSTWTGAVRLYGERVEGVDGNTWCGRCQPLETQVRNCRRAVSPASRFTQRRYAIDLNA